MKWPLQAVVGVRTYRGLNDRGHWRVHHERAQHIKTQTFWALRAARPPAKYEGETLIVTLTRVGPTRGLDKDNLQGSLKYARDSIAEFIGVDDGSDAVTWRYEQRRGAVWRVEIYIAIAPGT